MNERAAELGLEDTHFVRPDGLDVTGHYSTASDVLTLTREAMKQPLFRELVRLRGGRSKAAAAYAWNDLLRTRSYAGIIGVKTGHTDAAGWSQVAAARRQGQTMYAIVFGSPSRARRNADLSKLLDWGFGHFGRVTLVRANGVYATAAVPHRRPHTARRATDDGEGRAPRPSSGRARGCAVRRRLPVRRAIQVGEVVLLDGQRVIMRRPLVAGQRADDANVVEKAGWYAGRAVDEAGDMFDSVSEHSDDLTVTLNAAIDRTLLVPNFQLGLQRHRASVGFASAGGKGDQRRARAQAPRHAGRLHRARRGSDRDPPRRGPHRRRNPQRLRSHPRGVAHVHGGARPDVERVHGDQRVGAGDRRRRAGHAPRQAHLPHPVGRVRRFLGSLPLTFSRRCMRI